MAALRKFFCDFSNEYNAHFLKDTELTTVDRAELKWRRFSYYVFLFFVIGIGVPIWYFTTTPYRASLPYFKDEFRQRVKSVFADQHLFPELNDYGTLDGDVWSQMTLSSSYNVHFVFVHFDHENFGLNTHKFDAIHTQDFLKLVQKFGAIFNESIQIEFSAEHFWDFSLSEFLNRHTSDAIKQILLTNTSNKNTITSLTIKNTIIPALTAEIDRYSTPLIGSEPLIKVVVFLPTPFHRIMFVDENDYETKGLVVASWGGFVSYSLVENEIKNLTTPSITSLNAIFGILRTELGILTARQRLQTSKLAVITNDLNCTTLKCDANLHKFQLTIENLYRTIHFINSLHDLAAKIEDLVISEDVAKLANFAYSNFFIAYDSLIRRQQTNFDSLASIRAEKFAKLAITHPSLLEFLNFPSDQKYGIYVPLFFPALVPICYPFLSLFAFLLRKALRRTPSTKDDKTKSNSDTLKSAKIE